MRCRTAQRHLVTLLDGELTAEPTSRLNEHLAACASCVRVEQELRQTGELIQTAPGLTPTPDFTERLLRRVAQEAPEARAASVWRRTWVPRVAVPAVTVLVAALIFLTVYQPPTSAAPDAICKLEGLMCQGCAKSVRKILRGVEGVREVEVDLQTGTAKLWLNPQAAITAGQLQQALAKSSRFALREVEFATKEP